MEIYAAQYPPGYDFPTSTLIWGALIFVALVAAWLLVGKAIEWLRNRRLDGRAVEGGLPKIPEDPSDSWAAQAISRPSADYYEDELGGLGSMSQREQEQLFSTYAPRKVRKAMRARRRARELAQKQDKGSD